MNQPGSLGAVASRYVGNTMAFESSVFRVKQCKHCGEEIEAAQWQGDHFTYKHSERRIWHCVKDGVIQETIAEVTEDETGGSARPPR